MNADTIPTDILAARLERLAHAAAEHDWSEFSMRIPADAARDADLVMYEASKRLMSLQALADADTILRELVEVTYGHSPHVDAEAVWARALAWWRNEDAPPAAQPGTTARRLTSREQDVLQRALLRGTKKVGPAAQPEPVAEVLWHDPTLDIFPPKPGKIIDASIAWMEAAPIGTKLYAAPAPAPDGWVSVEDQLPPANPLNDANSQPVLFWGPTFKYGCEFGVLWYRAHGGSWNGSREYDLNEVTHWLQPTLPLAARPAAQEQTPPAPSAQEPKP